MAKVDATAEELISKIKRNELRLTEMWCFKVRRGRCPDDIFARLLALNAVCYEEEVNLELHSKGARAAARGGSTLQIGLL